MWTIRAGSGQSVILLLAHFGLQWHLAISPEQGATYSFSVTWIDEGPNDVLLPSTLFQWGKEVVPALFLGIAHFPQWLAGASRGQSSIYSLSNYMGGAVTDNSCYSTPSPHLHCDLRYMWPMQNVRGYFVPLTPLGRCIDWLTAEPCVSLRKSQGAY